jgi:two-component system sensor histidine kinase QseC
MYIDFEETDDDAQELGNAHIYETKLAFQIWDNEGNLVVKSYNAPLEPLTRQDAGFNNIAVGGSNWRTFSLLSRNHQYRCITAERVDVRNDLIIKISNDLFYLFIILVPALSLILYLSIDKGLKPLQRLAAQINRRSGENLELITSDYRYTEIVTIKNALNQLLHRLNDTLAREKRITSDAAHELRTPLAAIRLHTELAKAAKNRQQQDESLDQVIQGVDRTTHLVEQLLALARLEPELLVNDFAEVDLTALIIDECALLSPLAIEKDIELSFDEPESVHIHGHEPSLRLLIRNLLTNAISYTPPAGKVMISLTSRAQKAVLIIEDTGPGISKEDRERVMERFYRAENHQEPGCGIGLSIVDRVVEMHQGSLQLAQADSGQGLKVIIQL